MAAPFYVEFEIPVAVQRLVALRDAASREPMLAALDRLKKAAKDAKEGEAPVRLDAIARQRESVLALPAPAPEGE